MAEKKEKQYVSNNAQLMAEWDWEKNDELGLSPYVLTIGKTVKAWWKCSKGHQYQASIGNRNYGYGCPYCSGRYPIKGQSDLQTVNPSLAKEWNHKRNNGLTPADVLPNSDKKVWWICEKGHEWQTQVKVRTRGNGNQKSPYLLLLVLQQNYQHLLFVVAKAI